MTRERDKKTSREQQLLEAARLGHFNQLDTILNQLHQLKTKKRSNPLASLRKFIGVNNIRDPVTGFTCLHHAALNGDAQCVQLILNHGARLNALDYKGSSALHLAAWSGNLEAVRVLLSYCAPTSSSTAGTRRTATTATSTQPGSERSHSSSSSSSISQIAFDDHQQAQSIKLSSPRAKNRQQNEKDDNQHEELELDLRNNDGQTALSLAAQFGHSQVVAELLCRSADVNQRNNQLESALDLACLNGHLESVRLMLDSSPQLVHALRHSHSIVAMDSRANFNTGELVNNHQHQSTRSGWSSLLRGSGGSGGGGHSTAKTSTGKEGDRPRRASLAPAKIQEDQQHYALRWTQQSSLDSSLAPAASERLLGHSPLHYAVRGCHLNVVSLLLDQYEANLFQLTSRGSVIHELVLNSGCDLMAATNGSSRNNAATAAYYTNGELMRLFLAHLSRISAGNLEATRVRWNQLLSVRNSQQMSVFDLINELNNNRPAQELKRNIFELNEQIERSLQIQHQQQQLNQSAQGHNSLDIEQKAPNSGGQQQQQQQQYFSSARQINSFLTMNRAHHVKRQLAAASSLRPEKNFEVHNLVSNNDENKFHQQAISGTQTIDRRRNVGARGRNQDLNSWRYDASSFGSQQPAAITRSVSNLVNVNSTSNENDALKQAQLYGSVEVDWFRLMSNRGQNHEVQTVQEVQRRIDELQRQQNAASRLQVAKKRRSKSRDLGSLLMEINHNQQQGNESSTVPSMGDAEQLYDNQLEPDQHYQQTNQPHLVRSQTDCSHLLGKLTSGSDLHLALDQHHLVGPPRGQTAGDSARYHQFHLQHQPRSSDNSSSMLSGDSHHHESRRLVPTTIAQQHSATLDRRAINRHYHVYDHEFYPPRLVTDQTNLVQAKGHHHPIAPIKLANAMTVSDRQKQAAIAIVPPLVRSDLNSQQAGQANGSGVNTRLSLNIEQRPKKLDQREQFLLANMSERQRSQMNRFASAGPRKSMPVPGASSNQYNEQPATLLGNDCNQQLALHSSQSFESHFEANSDTQQQHLFESTRQALLQDFNKVIDHELLLRHDNQHSSRGSLGPIAHSASSSSQGSSILTGVSLDMDLQGENLIVSGTRVTIPPPPPPQQHRDMRSPQQPETSVGQVNELEMKVVTKNEKKCQLSASMSSNSSISSGSSNQRKPPQKPPRPSLKSQQIHKSLQLEVAIDSNDVSSKSPGSETSSIIYDQPSILSQSSSAGGEQRPAGLRSSSSSVCSPSGLMHGPMPLLATPLNKAGQSQNSITEPPSERPPPPPQPARASPMPSNRTLNVITTNLRSGSLGSNSPHSSTTSSSCASFRQIEPTAGHGNQPNLRMTTVAGVEAPTSQHCADVDSGFCTSNSPASHDSESGLNGSGTELHEPASLEAIWSKSSTSRANSVISVASPPSPRTAQMSIEEALVPLDELSETKETANQTEEIVFSPPNGSLLYERLSEIRQVASDDEDATDQRDDQSNRLDAQVETVFSWLKVTPKDRLSDSEGSKVAGVESETGNYENCVELQRELHSNSAAEFYSDGKQVTHSADSLVLPEALNDSATCSGNRPGKSSVDLVVRQTNGSSDEQSPKHCKEVLLKVVIDQSNKFNNDEVFYIDPGELKKISSSKDNSDTNETQTLTDEELCASVDKESGYIRFTLRKRRVMTDSVGQDQAASGAELLESCDKSQTTSSSAKRTKMNQDQTELESISSNVANNSAEKPMEESPAGEMESNRRKPSADSLQMDSSQASTSSSTSSEVSIKSIVSLRVQKLGGQEIGRKVELAKGTLEDSKQVECENQQTNNNNEVGPTQRRPKSSSLLVSEAVKKVDAIVQKPPVAAVRRNLGQLENGTHNLSQTDTRPRNVAPLRRSICWPPPKPGDDENKPAAQGVHEKGDDSCSSMPPPIMGRVTANRLSFQRLIEEQSKNNSVSLAANRPKPAPPVKPAGLVASQLLRSQMNK